MASIRQNLRDLFELVLLPGLAVLLPWPVCFRLFRRLCYRLDLYRDHSRAALRAAQRYNLAGPDENQWLAENRLTQLVDHADMYLSRFRSDRWLRYVDVKGDPWPPKGAPILAITFHWGAGMWCFRHLRHAGIRTAGISRYVDLGVLPGMPVRVRYLQARVLEVDRAGDSRMIFAGRGGTREMYRQIERGDSLIALIDVPPDERMQCLPVEFLARRARLPRGLIKFAVGREIPVYAYTMGIQYDSGRRTLRVRGPIDTSSEQTLADALAGLWEEAVSSQPQAWHFWPFVDQFWALDSQSDVDIPTLAQNSS